MDNLKNKSSIGSYGKKWTLDEEKRLFSLFNKGVSIADLSQIFQRTRGAIGKRLKILLNKNEKNVNIYRFFDKENEKMKKILTNDLINTNYVGVKKIAIYVNRIYNKKISGKEINTWLKHKGILIEKNNENGEKENIPTSEAQKYGIYQEKYTDKKKGKEYKAIVFTEKGKSLIINNINEIEKFTSEYKKGNKGNIIREQEKNTNTENTRTEKKETQLIFLFKEGRNTKKIANFFGESEGGIMFHLNKIGLIEYNSVTRHENIHTKELQNEELKLFEELRKIRLELAREEKMPPYIIFSDAVLKDIAKYRPQDKEDMLKIKGIKDRKFEKYGKTFIDKIKELGYLEKKESLNNLKIQKKISNIGDNIETDKINYIEKQKIAHECAYKKREKHEDEKLKKLFKDGVPVKTLSNIFKRSSGGIRSRLEKLGLIENFDLDEKLKESYLNGSTPRELANEFNITIPEVRSRLNNMGITI